MSNDNPTPAKPWYNRLNSKWIGWIVSAILVPILIALLTRQPLPTPPPPPDEPIIVQQTGDNGTDERQIQQAIATGRKVYTTGWHRDPAAVAAVQGTLPFRVFADTPAGQVHDLPPSVYLWQAYAQLPIRGPPSKDQRAVGSCVSFGTNNAIERTIAAAIANGARLEFKLLAEEVTYGGSRVEVGGGRIRGDGSTGAWAAQFVQKWGVVSREQHGRHDLREYNEARCREFGRTGVPDELETLAREHPVKAITRVGNWFEAKQALASGYGLAVCSNQGFTMRRDANGVAQPSGSWAHCMCIDGYHSEGSREYAHIENSWGPDAHTGPVGWGNPPTSGFWIEARVAERMIVNGGDTWAFSDVQGFPARRLDWFIERKRPTPRERFAGPVFALGL